MRNAVGVTLILALLVALPARAAVTPEEQPRIDGKKIVMIIAKQDFRDEELLKPKRFLESKGATVTVASSSLEPAKGMLGAVVKPDILLSNVKVDDFDVVIFVGGSGAAEYWNDPTAQAIARKTVEQNKLLCAICIAPVTLANAGVLKDKKATVWASEANRLKQAGVKYTGADVEIDGKIITADGPTSAQKFAETIYRKLLERMRAEQK